MRYLEPQNIIVVDNANSSLPIDDTEAAVRRVHEDIVYRYVPQGLKTLALWTGMQELPPNVEYMLHVDDDTVLCDHMIFDESWFDDPRTSEVRRLCTSRRAETCCAKLMHACITS